MGTEIPSNQPQIPATNSAAIEPSQGAYVMPVQQQISRIIRPVPGIKCLSITSTLLASLITVLGVVAVLIKARQSYIGIPIWTGLPFLLTTGILGFIVHKKHNNFCMNIAFLVMSIITSVFLFQLFINAMNSAGDERESCVPTLLLIHTHAGYCTPRWSRITVGVVITLCALAALVLCIVSCSLTMYGTFQCCYRCCDCCRNANSPPMVQYSPQTGVLMTSDDGQATQVLASPLQLVPQ